MNSIRPRYPFFLVLLISGGALADPLPPGYVQGDVVSYSYVPNKRWAINEGYGILPYICEYGLLLFDNNDPLEPYHAENVRRIDQVSQWSTAIMLYARKNGWRDELINLMIRAFSKRQLIILRNYWRPGQPDPFLNTVNILDTLWANRNNTLTNPEGHQATGLQLINNILAVKTGDEGECSLRTSGLQTIFATFKSVVQERDKNGQKPFRHIQVWYNMLHYRVGCHAASLNDVNQYGRFLLPTNTEWIGVDTYHFWNGSDPLTMTSAQRRAISDSWQDVITRYYPGGLSVSPCDSWAPECRNDTHALLNGSSAAGAAQATLFFIANSCTPGTGYHTTPIETMDAFYDSVKAGPWIGLSWYTYDNGGGWEGTRAYLDKTIQHFTGEPYTQQQLDDFHDRFIASRMRMFNDVVYNQFGYLNSLAPVINEVSPDPEPVLVGAAYDRQLTLQVGSAPRTWSVVTGPAGLTVDQNGYVSGWLPDASQVNQTVTITVRVSNAGGFDDETWQVRVEPLPYGVVAFHPFNADAQGWTLEGWRAGSLASGTIGWTSAGGSPAGHIRSTGAGITNDTDSCKREGGQMTRTISTVGYNSIRIEYRVIAELNAPPATGCTGTCTGVIVESGCEDKLALYYSTAGTGGPWTLAQVLTEGVDLPTTWTRQIVDLTAVPAAGNNPNFALRFKWQFNTEQDSGRIDNIIVRSTAFDINAAPQVDAGSDQVIVLPASADLHGTVVDDYLPDPPRQFTVTWSKQSGPGVVTFGDPHATDTTASFNQAGVYVLRLTADDSELSAYDTVTVTVRLSRLPDFDHDEDVDMEDFGYFQVCLSGTGVPRPDGCSDADLDTDGDVDDGDLTRFLQCLGGAGQPPPC